MVGNLHAVRDKDILTGLTGFAGLREKSAFFLSFILLILSDESSWTGFAGFAGLMREMILSFSYPVNPVNPVRNQGRYSISTPRWRRKAITSS